MTDDVKNQGQSADLGDTVASAAINDAVQGAEGQEAAIEAPKELSLREMEQLPKEELEKLLSGEPAAAAPAEGAEGTDTVAGDAAPDTVASTTKADGIMIPKARLDEVLDQKRKAEEELAFYKGKAEGLKESVTKPAVDANIPDPRQALQEITNTEAFLEKKYKEERGKIADQFDAGKLTERQKLEAYDRLEEQRNRIADKIYESREKLIEQINAPSADDVLADPRLQEASQQLYAEEPWLTKLPKQAVDTLRQLTEERLASQGKRLKATVEDTWTLRVNMAVVGKELGMNLKYGNPTQAPAANTGKPPLPSSAQVASKLALAAKLPPAPGSAGTTTTTVSSDLKQIEENIKGQSEWEMAMNHTKEFFQKQLGV